MDAECPGQFVTWNTHRVLDNQFASWQQEWEDMELEATAFDDTSIDTSIGSTILKDMLVDLEAKGSEFELDAGDMNMYFNTSHNTHSPELEKAHQGQLSPTAPPFISPRACLHSIPPPYLQTYQH